MTSVETELEVIVDDEMVEMIDRYRKAHAEYERGEAAAEALGATIEEGDMKGKRTLRRAQLDMEELADADGEAWERWQSRLKEGYHGTTLVLDGIAYTPQGVDDDTFTAKILSRNGVAPATASINSHANGTTASPPCQRAAHTAPDTEAPAITEGVKVLLITDKGKYLPKMLVSETTEIHDSDMAAVITEFLEATANESAVYKRMEEMTHQANSEANDRLHDAERALQKMLKKMKGYSILYKGVVYSRKDVRESYPGMPAIVLKD